MISPKEKARDLVHKFSMEIFFYISNNLSDIEESKRFALIAVDEILSLGKKTTLETLEYYLEVKTELEKL
jgi:hypothetical protein